jgi:hypothetical protein
MTTQEQQMLQDLTDRINNTQLPEKDPEAERYLRDTLGRNPDALYILAQTVLVTQYALEQAQKQLADAKAQLQAQAAQPKHATSFLGNLLGHNDEPAPPPPPPPQYSQPQYTPVPNYGAPQAYYPPQYPQYGAPQPGYGVPQQGGFLRSAMQTATGVAAGALAFEGIESLMHGFGGHQGGGYGFEGGGGRPEEIVNNYYGDSASHEHSGGNLGSDIEDRRNDFAGSGTNDTYSDDSSDGNNDFDSSDDSSSGNDDSSL